LAPLLPEDDVDAVIGLTDQILTITQVVESGTITGGTVTANNVSVDGVTASFAVSLDDFTGENNTGSAYLVTSDIMANVDSDDTMEIMIPAGSTVGVTLTYASDANRETIDPDTATLSFSNAVLQTSQYTFTGSASLTEDWTNDTVGEYLSSVNLSGNFSYNNGAFSFVASLRFTTDPSTKTTGNSISEEWTNDFFTVNNAVLTATGTPTYSKGTLTDALAITNATASERTAVYLSGRRTAANNGTITSFTLTNTGSDGVARRITISVTRVGDVLTATFRGTSGVRATITLDGSGTEEVVSGNIFVDGVDVGDISSAGTATVTANGQTRSLAIPALISST
jgi:hypothetical protein